ncbi:MAG: 3-phosphoshikimate 1-carboxyvinyltransferase [Chlorobi bacterium]|nr:3-phosphoshikimate 1-carboxyvinyltransferase [Chlorobiota bacterium]
MKEFTVKVEFSDLSGSLSAPSSKSMMIRALAGAWLAEGKSRIFRPSRCRDAMDVSRTLIENGVRISREEDMWEIDGGTDIYPESVIDVGESGLGARLFIPLAARYAHPVTIQGAGSLLQRPVNMVTGPLTQLGIDVQTSGGYLPVTVKGPLKGGKVTADGSQGSQFITGLLMALPLAATDSVLTVQSLRSRPYVDLTIEVLSLFGIYIPEHNPDIFTIPGNQHYQATDITIEGDWSGAAFLLVAAAIAGEVTVAGLNPGSRQADRMILDVLKKAGVSFRVAGDEVTVSSGHLRPFDFDITHCPDLAPPLLALAAYAEGTSVLSGAGRLLTKESNRAETLSREAGNLGVRVEQTGDTLVIHGGKVNGGKVHAHNDHRIAMAAAVMGLHARKPVIIDNASCVEKSYPQFFEDFKKLGAKVYQESY